MKNFNPLLIISIFMPLFYMGLGVYLLINPQTLGYNVQPLVTMVFGGLLIAFGIFRAWRVYKSFYDNA
ncbi:hypothetical protein RCC89_15505 [Cytophagaceae bacterium ABcell3]|nr:hypothetical protein RCC89_15505 [Cytophagaceae bacterium ABcell3]